MEVQTTDAPVIAAKKSSAGYRPQLYKPGQSGNPAGRPKGAKNRHNAIREMLVGCANRDTMRIFKRRLQRPEDRATFTKAMDQLIALIGPAKPLVEIDQSHHTHLTVVVDAPSA